MSSLFFNIANSVSFETIYGTRRHDISGRNADADAVVAFRVAKRFEHLEKAVKIDVFEANKDNALYEEKKGAFDRAFKVTPKGDLVDRKELGASDSDPHTRGYIKAMDLYHTYAHLLRGDFDAFHLAELPGGFYFGLQRFAKMHGTTIHATAQSLHPRQPDAFEDSYGLGERGVMDYGDYHGDLSRSEMVPYYVERYAGRHLVTCDFGFKAHDDTTSAMWGIFNNIVAIVQGIAPQVFIMKCYLHFSPLMLRVFYDLYRDFGSLSFYKPYYSRPHSFEIYVVASRSDAPRMSYEEFLTDFYPFAKEYVDKVKRIYSIFERCMSYRVSERDCAHIIRIKERLLSALREHFTAPPRLRPSSHKRFIRRA